MQRRPSTWIIDWGTLLTTMLFLTSASTVSAEPKRWEPEGGTGLWNDGPHWEPDGVPGEGDSIGIEAAAN